MCEGLKNFRDKLIVGMAECLFGLDEPETGLQKILKDFLSSNRGGSCVVSGHSRTGKTSVVRRVVEEFQESAAELTSTYVNGLDYADATEAAPLKLIKKEDKQGRRIIIIDHFEQFTRRNQVVLYHVLNQSQNAPVFVILICERQSCVDLLEKRVRSRLSNKKISFDVQVTLDDFCNAFFSMISCEGNAEWIDYVQVLRKNDLMRSSLETAYEMDGRYSTAKSLAIVFVTLSEGNPQDMPRVLTAVVRHEDPMENVVENLSVRQICLMKCFGDNAETNYKAVTTEFKRKANTTGLAVMKDTADAVLNKDMEELVAVSAIAAHNAEAGQEDFRKVYVNMDLSLLPECPMD
ncbi:Origin recognition complex subunit 4-like protein [Aphelenchoides avenae]|nr:Origin recognition complex subunit 4-like protein [Aphelenchus avenae]